MPTLVQIPPKNKNTRYRWARHPDGERLRDIGYSADGTLINPNQYPEARVRETIAHANACITARRKKAAAKGAITRKRRRDAKVYRMAQKIVEGHVYGPRNCCCICGRGLDDADSIERGIGSECWESVLQMIEARYGGDDDIADPSIESAPA